MNKRSAFENFAPAILKIYHRNKEAFWEAVLAPFLTTKHPALSWLKHLHVDIGILSAFKGLDDDARKLLKGFSAQIGRAHV